MLDESIHHLEGAIELSRLRHDAEVEVRDSDFQAFVLVSSETDDLPIGDQRRHWSKEALERHESEMRRSIQWAKEVSLAECKSLAERFSAL